MTNLNDLISYNSIGKLEEPIIETILCPNLIFSPKIWKGEFQVNITISQQILNNSPQNKVLSKLVISQKSYTSAESFLSTFEIWNETI